MVSEAGNHLVVQKLLGRGGRRDVYEVLVSETGERKALKWYKQRNGAFDKEIYANLMMLANMPSPDASLIWVDDLVSTPDHGFGYITPLIPDGYISYFSFMRERELSPIAKCNFAIDLLRAFHNAWAKGLLLFTADGASHFLIHPETGHLLIEECERTAPFGNLPYPMIYHPKYAAPEVILGRRTLDIRTNRFSIAVVLFMLFFEGHPLEGKQTLVPCLTPQLEKRFYGDNPVFVFDPEDSSNCPMPAIHSKLICRWNEAPDYLKNIFIKAFSQKALHIPSLRPNEKEFAQVIYRYKAEITMQ